MIKLNLYYSTVTDNNDKDKKGKVQIRILPEFKDIKESLLPWASPFISSGFDSNNNSMQIPEIGAKLWAMTNDKFTYFRYLYGAPIEGLFNYDSIKSKLDTISELSDSVYPNINFDLTSDGSIYFHNRISGDHGFLHSTGTYYIIDNTGTVYISALGNTIEMSSTSVMINSNLEILQ